MENYQARLAGLPESLTSSLIGQLGFILTPILMPITDHVQKAASCIGQNYFALPVCGMPTPIKRERVYCYELYHQLRCLSLGTTVTAEPDKRGHPSFAAGRAPNPDMVFHMPGGDSNNAAVIEVECSPTLRHLRKDLGTLKIMKEHGYRELILLLFSISAIPWRQIESAARSAQLDLSAVVVLLHPAAGQKAAVACPPKA